MPSAIETQGTTLEISSGSPTEYSNIPNITDFSGPGGQATVIDVSNLSSTRKEKIMGLADEGQFTFNVNWDPDDAAHQQLLTSRDDRSVAEFRLTLTDSTPTTGVFLGYVLGVVLSGGVDAVVKGAVTVEITGAITWA